MSSNAFNACAAEAEAADERRTEHATARAVSGLLSVVKVLRSQGLPATAAQVDSLAQELLGTLSPQVAEMVRASVQK